MWGEILMPFDLKKGTLNAMAGTEYLLYCVRYGRYNAFYMKKWGKKYLLI